MKKLYISAIIALAASSLSTSAQVTQEEKDFRKWEEVIASDSFGGRAPLTLTRPRPSTISHRSSKALDFNLPMEIVTFKKSLF